MQAKEQYSLFFVKKMDWNVFPHVLQVFSYFGVSEYRHFFEQYIFLCPPRGYFLLNSLSQILHLSIIPLNKG